MDSLADAVASPASADNESLPYGSSHWDRKPAEVHDMILRAAGPLTLFVNGLLGDKDSLDEATVEALWTDAISIDWQGDLARLPDITPYACDVYQHERPALDMLSLPVSRSMYGRLCARFPDQDRADDSAQYNGYHASVHPSFSRIESTLLHHIPMRNCWFDLVDFSYPIALGWQAIFFGHAGLLRHLAEHHGVVLKEFESFALWKAMDLAALNGHVDILQMLHDAGSTSCSHNAMDYAAMSGHLKVVMWLHANRTEGCTTNAIDLASEEGRHEVVRFLLACGYEFTFDALRKARNDAIIDVLVDCMTLERATEMLEMARVADEHPELVERLERAVAEKQA